MNAASPSALNCLIGTGASLIHHRMHAEPKSVADAESLQSQWLTIEEIRTRQLRGSDLIGLLEHVAQGRQVYPLDLLGGELSI